MSDPNSLLHLARALTHPITTPSSGIVRRERDLTILALSDDTVLVVACDSLGAIGPKPGDAVAASGEDVGYFTARVPLLETLCSGAKPVLVIDALAVELEPTGVAILEGVRHACREAGLDPSLAITGSTEENVPTSQTALGVTVLGVCPRSTLRPGTSQPGDGVYLVGLPKSAPAHHVFRGDPAMVTFEHVWALLAHPACHDLLPIGSRGALWEARQMAASASLNFQPDPSLDPDLLRRSGGPATALLASISAPPTLLTAPYLRLGTLTA